MRYRYHLRTAAGDMLSRHRSHIGALEALAVRRRQLGSGDIIWDLVQDREAGTSLEAFVESADLLVVLSPAEKARLREIAREVGAFGRGGRSGVGPSPHRLVKEIASGELAVSRPGTGGEEE